MATEIIMPKTGLDMTEGEIVSWRKNEGDPVQLVKSSSKS